MANFCTKCGKKLIENKKCDCDIIKNDNIKEVPDNDLFISMKEVIKKPINAFKNQEKYQKNNYIYILFTSISYGLLSMIFNYHSSIYNFVSVSFISFIILILLSFITSCVGNYIFKINQDFEKDLTIISTSSIFLLYSNLIAIVCSFLSFTLSEIVVLLSLILFVIYYYHGLYINSKIDHNKIGYFLVTNISILIFTIYFFSLIF